MLLPVDMAFHPFLFLSVILSLPYGPSLLTLLHECESSCVLVSFNGRDSFVHFSMVLFYRFCVLYCILCVLPYGVINNNNKIT